MIQWTSSHTRMIHFVQSLKILYKHDWKGSTATRVRFLLIISNHFGLLIRIVNKPWKFGKTWGLVSYQKNLDFIEKSGIPLIFLKNFRLYVDGNAILDFNFWYEVEIGSFTNDFLRYIHILYSFCNFMKERKKRKERKKMYLPWCEFTNWLNYLLAWMSVIISECC